MTRILVIVGIVVALLVATNPSRDELNDWARTYVMKKIEAEARKSGQGLDDGSATWGGAIAELFIAHMPIERWNLLVLSIYQVELPPEKAGETRTCSIVGVAGQFIPLSGC